MIETQFRKLGICKGQGAKTRARLHWIKEGSKDSKCFFKF